MDDTWAEQKLTDLRAKADATQRRYHARRPRKIGDVISNVITSRRYGALETQAQLVEAWKQAAGGLANFSTPLAVNRGKLEVTVASSLMMQELTFAKRQIITRLRAALPEAKISDLKFRVGNINN